MSDYPYLAAVLPTLRFEDAAFPSSQRFLSEAEKWLEESEFELLSGVRMDRFEERDHPMLLVDEFYRFERRVRRDVAEFIECRRAGRDHKARMFPTSFLKDTTPLEAERRLLRLRWDWISSRLDAHTGDLHALVVYRLQLQVLERLWAFDGDQGATRFAGFTDIESIPREVTSAP